MRAKVFAISVVGAKVGGVTLVERVRRNMPPESEGPDDTEDVSSLTSEGGGGLGG